VLLCVSHALRPSYTWLECYAYASYKKRTARLSARREGGETGKRERVEDAWKRRQRGREGLID